MRGSAMRKHLFLTTTAVSTGATTVFTKCGLEKHYMLSCIFRLQMVKYHANVV